MVHVGCLSVSKTADLEILLLLLLFFLPLFSLLSLGCEISGQFILFLSLIMRLRQPADLGFVAAGAFCQKLQERDGVAICRVERQHLISLINEV